jgi:holo-[acyl-carrier protein] synthase
VNVVGHGVDLVALERFARIVRERGPRFLERCFTAGELAYADSRGVGREATLAARFAAKEAVLKALGTGLAAGVSWSEIEVERDAAGRPLVALHGRARARAERAGVSGWLLSLTHDGDYALASVLALGPTDGSQT